MSLLKITWTTTVEETHSVLVETDALPKAEREAVLAIATEFLPHDKPLTPEEREDAQGATFIFYPWLAKQETIPNARIALLDREIDSITREEP